MLSVAQAIILGLIQGFTELFPISSLGHSVIIPGLFSWHIHQDDPYFVTFLVATHVATAVVLFIFFWDDWMKILAGLWRTIKTRSIAPGDTYARLGWLLVVGSIPAGILGLALDKPLRTVFGSPQIAAMFLVFNGFMLYGAERLRKRGRNRPQTAEQSDQKVASLSIKRAIGIGTAQAGALLPGISRSGASMAGGLLSGLNNEQAARFSFLLATPIIGAAALLKLPKLADSSMSSEHGAFLAGAICAAISAYFSVKFLVKYFETRTLTPFAYYCIFGGILYSFLLLTK
jgi:undecaprenyl-diphosphatase